MFGVKVCPKCGVPKRLVKENKWLSDGTIVQSKNPDHRMIFIECENINATYRNVEEIIGVSIEHIIIEAKRRATFDFIDHMLPTVVKYIVKLAGVRLVVRNVSGLGSVMGIGRLELKNLRRMHGKGDYATFEITEPYSIPLFCGDLAGTFEAIDRREVGVTYKELTTDVYEVTGHITKHPLELKERLQARTYTHKPGDIQLERCPRCGGPSILSQYDWDTDRGVVTSKSSGHRMTMLGPAAMESIVDELERELGDTIPQTVVEAQRRFAKTGFYSLEEASSGEDLNMHLAKRGMGNLREMEWEENRLRLRLENPCLHLLVVGLIQGFFELASGQEAEVEWKLAEDGDLTIEVTPK
jgi:hypothetical protein